MASESVIDALVTRWATTVTTTGYPSEIWFDGVPTTKTGDVAVTLPNVELFDLGTVPEYDFEENPVAEVTRVRFVVRAVTLAELDSVVKRLKYGGGGVAAGLGFDQPASLPFSAGIELRAMLRTREQRSREASRWVGAQIVHKCEIDYEVRVERVGV